MIYWSNWTTDSYVFVLLSQMPAEFVLCSWVVWEQPFCRLSYRISDLVGGDSALVTPPNKWFAKYQPNISCRMAAELPSYSQSRKLSLLFKLSFHPVMDFMTQIIKRDSVHLSGHRYIDPRIQSFLKKPPLISWALQTIMRLKHLQNVKNKRKEFFLKLS